MHQKVGKIMEEILPLFWTIKISPPKPNLAAPCFPPLPHPTQFCAQFVLGIPSEVSSSSSSCERIPLLPPPPASGIPKGALRKWALLGMGGAGFVVVVVLLYRSVVV